MTSRRTRSKPDPERGSRLPGSAMIPLGRAQSTGFEKLLADLDKRLMA
jgi:hypothetical protein